MVFFCPLFREPQLPNGVDTSTTNSCPVSGYCRRTYQGFLWQVSRKTSGIRICCATTLPFDGPESVVFSVHAFVSRSCPTEWTQAPRILVPFLDIVVPHTKDSCGKCLEKRVISESAVQRHYPISHGPESVVFSVHSFVSRSSPTEWTQAPRIVVQFLDTLVAPTKDSCGKGLTKSDIRICCATTLPHFSWTRIRGVFCPLFRELQPPNGVDTSTTNSCPFLDTVVAHTKEFVPSVGKNE